MSITILIGLFMMFFPLENPQSNSASSAVFMETTTTGVGYGRPTASCDGAGICIVSSLRTNFEIEDNFSKAALTFGRDGNVTRILADAKTMTKKTIEKHFSGKTFIMMDPYKGTLEMGGKSLKINIPAGNHRLTRTKEGFLIEIGG